MHVRQVQAMSTRGTAVMQHVRGLTLVELLVALALGLLITVATVAGYLGLSEASKVAEAHARMDDDGQAALAVLAAHLRMAGSNPDRRNRIPSDRKNPIYPLVYTFAVRGCDGPFANVATAASIQDLTCTSGSPGGPDSVSVTYEADRYNTVSPASVQPTDCLGHPLDARVATVTESTGVGMETDIDVTYHAAENRFYIASASDGSPVLYCRGNGLGSTASPLVENVEDMQLSYGTVRATESVIPSANVAGYLDASELTTHATLAALPEAARWEKVASVRVCVVIKSSRPLASGPGSAQYLKCDGTLETSPPDLHLRRAYSATVVLRNRRS
jgi:type IV pilus assembly protein PilW